MHERTITYINVLFGLQGVSSYKFFIITSSSLIMSGFAVEFTWCVWKDDLSGKKNLWIKKYPDPCVLGLIAKKVKRINRTFIFFF